MPSLDNWPDAAPVEELKKKGDIKGLIRVLLQKNDHTSILAVRALGGLRDPQAVEPLMTALRERSAIVRMAVVEALGQIGDTRALDSLKEALQDHTLSALAAQALGELREPGAIGVLFNALKDKRQIVRIAAVRALGKIGGPHTPELLNVALTDTMIVVRMTAAQALGEVPSAKTVGFLAAALSDHAAGVRMEAVRALSKINDPDVIAPLTQALQDSSPDVRMRAVSALSIAKSTLASGPLRAALRDHATMVRHAAVWALSEIGDASVVAPLIIALNDVEPETRSAAALALGKIGDSRAFTPLIGALSDPHIDVRGAAALALGKLGDARAVEPLIAAFDQQSFTAPMILWALRREHWGLREAATRALGRATTAQDSAALTLALNDPQPEVRSAAATALQRIEARVGRLRIALTEQEKLKTALGRLVAVNLVKWTKTSGSRYGPQTPGDDPLIERIFEDVEQAATFVIEAQPALNARWSATSEAVLVEYADHATRQLNERLVIIKRNGTNDYLCYRAWALVY